MFFRFGLFIVFWSSWRRVGECWQNQDQPWPTCGFDLCHGDVTLWGLCPCLLIWSKKNRHVFGNLRVTSISHHSHNSSQEDFVTHHMTQERESLCNHFILNYCLNFGFKVFQSHSFWSPLKSWFFFQESVHYFRRSQDWNHTRVVIYVITGVLSDLGQRNVY